MKIAFLSFFLVSIITIYAFPAEANDRCLECHGERGMPGYVDKKAIDQSVHKGIDCRKCHMDVGEYPHGSVLKVNCGSCHFLGREGAPREQALEYKLSVHGTAVRLGKPGAPLCQTCHGSHTIYPSSDARSRTNRSNVPKLCSGCHAQEFKDYEKSIHGKEFIEKRNATAAVCFDCHLEHQVPSTGDPVWKLSLIQECGNCHAEELDTYRKTFHGKVTRLGYETMAKCSDCHGSHMILPVADENSMLSPRNKLATCRACHPNATEGFTKYYAHAEELNRKKYPELFYTYIFMTTLLIGVFAFFFTHTFLWAYRSLKEKLRQKKGGE
jgi:hypothetical protein